MTPEPGTPMVPLDDAREILVHALNSTGPTTRTWAVGKECMNAAAVPWPAPPATRDDEGEPCARCTETARIIESRGDPTRDDNDLVRVPRWAVEGAVFDYEKGLSDFGQRFVQDEFRTALAATRDDHHPAEPLSEAALARIEVAEYGALVYDFGEFVSGVLDAAGCVNPDGSRDGDALESYDPILDQCLNVLRTTITGLLEYMTPQQVAAFNDDYARNLRAAAPPTTDPDDGLEPHHVAAVLAVLEARNIDVYYEGALFDARIRLRALADAHPNQNDQT